MNFFVYDNDEGKVMIEDTSLLLTKEFEVLLSDKRNKIKGKIDKTKSRAFREFKYIYLFFDWQSPYFKIPEHDRHEEALKDADLTQEEFDDEDFKAACRKYDYIQNSSIEMKLLKAAMSAIDKQIFYLENIDLQERDPVTGKPIFKSKDLIAEIKGSENLITTLRSLEQQVKTGIEDTKALRGNVEAGMFD